MELADAGEVALLHEAQAARHSAVGGQGVAEAEADGDVVVVRLGQFVGEPLVGTAAVEVVGVDDAVGSADLGAGAQHGLARSPRLGSVTRSLEHVADLDVAAETGGHVLFHRVPALLGHDEHGVVEARLHGVVDGKVEQRLVRRA